MDDACTQVFGRGWSPPSTDLWLRLAEATWMGFDNPVSGPKLYDAIDNRFQLE
jgi:hypothetical protein